MDNNTVCLSIDQYNDLFSQAMRCDSLRDELAERTAELDTVKAELEDKEKALNERVESVAFWYNECNRLKTQIEAEPGQGVSE